MIGFDFLKKHYELNKVIQSCIDVTWLLVKEIEGVSQGDKFNDGREIHEMMFFAWNGNTCKILLFFMLSEGKRDGAF
jgi:SUMO ligase MMS21 Smc5/6 complex component